jgi:hypothetical protein
VSTSASTQILDTAVELTGISIVSATKTNDAPRLGTIYNPTTLAAGIPVWFHARQDGRYIGLFSERWTAATIGTAGPQTYSAHTESTVPSWVSFDPVTGSAGAVTDIPTLKTGTQELVAAVSRVDYLFTVGTLDDVAFIQHHRVASDGGLVLSGEETLDDVEGVVFSYGCYIDGDYLVVLGVDTDHKVHRARKHWSRIGTQDDAHRQWQFWGARGWYTASHRADVQGLLDTAVGPDPDNPVDPAGITRYTALLAAASLAPLTDTSGAALTSVGPISYAKFKDREWISVMSSDSAQFYSSRIADTAWRAEGAPVACDYLHLQPQLNANSAMLPEGHLAAMPYLSVDIDLTTDANALHVSWGLLGV